MNNAANIIGDVFLPVNATEDIIKRFWSKIDKNGPIPERYPELGPCWIWTAKSKSDWGYGWFHIHLKLVKAHRFSWLLKFGKIPSSKPNVLHRCDNPACVNPDHLWLGTIKDNSVDMVKKGRSMKGPKSFAWRFPNRLPRGEKCWNSKLTEEDVIEILRQHKNGATQKEIAERFGVCRTNILLIVNGKRWKHIPR